MYLYNFDYIFFILEMIVITYIFDLSSNLKLDRMREVISIPNAGL